MLVLLRFVLLLALCAPVLAQRFSDLPRADVYFVVPTLGSDGNVAQQGDRLVLEELAPGKDGPTDKVRAYLDRSAAWDLVRRLYGYAWKKSGGAGAGALVLAVTDMFGAVGPSHAGYGVIVKRPDGTQVEGGSFMILADVHAPPSGMDGPDLTLDVLMQNDYLALALAHESGHQVMWDRYGSKSFPRNRSLSKSGHDVHQITDPHLAFSEGWAEAFEAIVGDFLEAAGQMPKAQAPSIKLLMQRRHDLIERDRYIYEDHLKKTGHMKSGMQMVATEGVAAFLIYQTYANRIFKAQGQPAAYGAVLDTLAKHKPQDLLAFWYATMQDVPELREKLVRIWCEGTRYGTITPDAGTRYYEMWAAAQASAKLPKGHPGKADAYAVEKQWTAWKEQLFTAARASGKLDGALAPGLDPLWIDHGMRRVGLNLATEEELADFRSAAMGLREDHHVRSAAIVEHRDDPKGPGYFKNLAAVGQVALPEEMAAFEAGFREFESNRANEAGTVQAYVQRHADRFLHAQLARMLCRP